MLQTHVRADAEVAEVTAPLSTHSQLSHYVFKLHFLAKHYLFLNTTYPPVLTVLTARRRQTLPGKTFCLDCRNCDKSS